MDLALVDATETKWTDLRMLGDLAWTWPVMGAAALGLTGGTADSDGLECQGTGWQERKSGYIFSSSVAMHGLWWFI